MSGHHIPFHTLSDLFDNEIGPGAERDALMRHLASCTECALEYRRLESTVRLCGEYGCASCVAADFPDGAMARIRTAKKRKLFARSLPAVAASVLVVAGVGLFNAGIIGVRDRGSMAGGGLRKSVTETEMVNEIIRRHNATITSATTRYVEGTVPLSSFNDLRRGLGSRKLDYMLVDGFQNAPAERWNDAIESVGLSDGGGPVMTEPGASKRIVLFRVYR